MNLRSILSIPYIVGMESFEEDGAWIRRAEYPEIPGCFIEKDSKFITAVRLMDDLEKHKLNCIFGLLDRGETIPQPREPIESMNPAYVLKQFGLTHLIEHLDTDIQVLRQQNIFKIQL